LNWPIKKTLHIPINLGTIHNEVLDCYVSQNYILCASGIRALIEGLCKDKKVLTGLVKVKDKSGKYTQKRKKDLRGKINGLYEKGILTKTNTEFLHTLRFLGNEAIHELNKPSSRELLLAIEIVNSIITSVYEIPEKSKELKIVRKAKKKI